jgi:predicted naringenin-chalcone synthase
MEKYKQAAIPLALEAASQALIDSQTAPEDITHLITVSCTGQFLPGLDAALIVQLGLSPYTQRIPLQFLGCAAGLKAVCLSKQIATVRTEAKILVVCVELCTLHIQPSSEREALFGASFFGDGASSCVIGEPEIHHRRLFELGDDFSVLLPESGSEMIWEVGNTGFDLYLSPSIPKLLGRYLPQEIERMFFGGQLPELWAIHPGGRGIIDIIQELFNLSEEQTSPSRSVLRDYGNMSSATILFVLDAMRREWDSSGQEVSSDRNGVALAFGPGLTAEMIKITYSPAGYLVKEGELANVHV